MDGQGVGWGGDYSGLLAAGPAMSPPSGAEALGAVLISLALVALILVVTDLAGLTRIFPWSRRLR